MSEDNKVKRPKNIVFSSTRQWNPGDEFILYGIKKLLRTMGVDFNSLLYNRHPGIRDGGHQPLVPQSMLSGYGSRGLFTCDEFDNSIKPWHAYSDIDLIVFAGTPEWDSQRCLELYYRAIENSIPVMLIGVDYFGKPHPIVREVCRLARFFSTRNPEILSTFLENGFDGVKYLPCPSLLSSDFEKTISEAKNIGLIFQGKRTDLPDANSIEENIYSFQVSLFFKVIEKYGGKSHVAIVCHYNDELLTVRSLFPEIDCYYSYDSGDYYDIYKRFDMVIGTRIHGIGIAASCAIPGIPIQHDYRAGTTKGFLAEKTALVIEPSSSLESALNVIEHYIEHIQQYNQNLKMKKREAMSAYMDSLQKLFQTEEAYCPVRYEKSVYAKRDGLLPLSCIGLLPRNKDLYFPMIIREVLEMINQKISGKKILIKGGGEHTKNMLPYITPTASIVGIVNNSGKQYEDIAIYSNADLDSVQFDYVLISSMMYEDEMLLEMERIVQPEKIIPFYAYLAANGINLDREFYYYI